MEEEINKIEEPPIDEGIHLVKSPGFKKGNKLSALGVAKKKENRKKKIKALTLASVEDTNYPPSERLVMAMNRVIELYQKIGVSITDEDLMELSVNEKINALQKLSYIHATTKKFKPNMQFIKINTTKASTEKLEDALLKFNEDEQEE